jgi:deoxyribodipyrimidine photo-lyase
LNIEERCWKNGFEMHDSSKTIFFWFRRDLRLEDNTGLLKALEEGAPIQPLFIFDTNIIDELSRDDPRVSFIYAQLERIHLQLRDRGSSLLVMNGNPVEILRRLMDSERIAAAYANKDYEPYARERDSTIGAMLKRRQIPFHLFKDQVIFEGDEVVKKDGKPYTVYTPFKRRWKEKFSSAALLPQPGIPASGFYSSGYSFPTLESLGFMDSHIQVPSYDLSVAAEYASRRDYPAVNGTSLLSPHLRFGTVSIRNIVAKLDPEHETLLGELIWREFFMQILYHFPNVVDQSFHSKYEGIQWRNEEEEFQQWCEGKTGYPMVDAGMRQLNQTGFMHNRVRMVTASFLCKHLLIDWRWGEAYFAEKLLDYELSSNNGNWQWAAGTGCDAAPYFRVFNPHEQLKRFDPDHEYVRKWIPEFETPDYPAPMIDHREARNRALEIYKKGIELSRKG